MERLKTVEEVAKSTFKALIDAHNIIGDDVFEYETVTIQKINEGITQDRASTLAVLREGVEKKHLLEASFPDSPFTLDWKMGYNRALEDVATLLQETLGEK